MNVYAAGLNSRRKLKTSKWSFRRMLDMLRCCLRRMFTMQVRAKGAFIPKTGLDQQPQVSPEPQVIIHQSASSNQHLALSTLPYRANGMHTHIYRTGRAVRTKKVPKHRHDVVLEKQRFHCHTCLPVCPPYNSMSVPWSEKCRRKMKRKAEILDCALNHRCLSMNS